MRVVKTAVKVSASPSTAGPGDPVEVTASRLKSNEQVKIRIHSDPVELTEAKADKNGEVHVAVTIPDQLEAGDHQIEILGNKTGSHLTPIAITQSATVSSTPDSSDSSTPWALIALGLALLVGIAVAAVAVSRRRGARDPSAVS